MCMEACSFYLDIDAVIDKPECITDFDKLMKCAAGKYNQLTFEYLLSLSTFICYGQFVLYMQLKNLN